MSIRNVHTRRLGWTGTCDNPRLDGSMADATLWSQDCYHTSSPLGAPSTAGATSPAVIVPLSQTASTGLQLTQTPYGLAYEPPGAANAILTPAASVPIPAAPVAPIPAQQQTAPPFSFGSVPWYYWAGGIGGILLLFGRK
jgi:hypothetical protein